MGMTILCACDTHKVICNDFGHLSLSGSEVYDEGVHFLISHTGCKIRIGIDQWDTVIDPAYSYDRVKYKAP